MSASDVTFAIKNALIERQRDQYERLRALAQATLPLCDTEKQTRDLKTQLQRLAKAIRAQGG